VSTITGEVRRHDDFASRHLRPRRTVLVWLPPGYDAPGQRRKRYPVLYLHDGQNLFDGATSFIPGQEWGVDETADRLIRAGQIEPVLIVGIYNSPDRILEYTPTRDRKNRGGGGDLYGKFLVEDLKPFIDRTYRTKKGPADTALGGSSLGGLISLYLGLKHPKTFGKLAILSPSVWWDGRAIVKTVEALPQKPKTKIWLDMGTRESEDGLNDARALRDALLQKSWTLGADLAYLEAEGAGHNEASWAARIEPILRFLFPIGEK
jgi:predicted alpha/beta superfamily hydrolase